MCRVFNKCWIFIIVLFLPFISIYGKGFVRHKGGHFEIANKPYYYVGTNFWYGAILASKGQGGDRVRLKKELNLLKASGVNNLRVLVGGDGPNNIPTRIEPTLQVFPGIYNDTIFDGLDFLLKELGKRKMYAVLYLNNSWEWSGGYSQYLNWAGYGDFPLLNIDGWDVFRKYVEKYAECTPCNEMFKNHVRYVLTRTNRYTGKKYIDDPAIMAWQIGNEPRAFSNEAKPAFIHWIRDVAAYVKTIDRNHLLSIGSEGEKGCEEDMDLWKTIHSDQNIDYTTIHIWPYNWKWLDKNDMESTYKQAIVKTKDYLQKHMLVARSIGKPLVVEEFGFPRDNMEFTRETSTKYRDFYYDSVFSALKESASRQDVFGGCNFWAWGGYGVPKHVNWQHGDDYLGDPAQEEQGLNSVFSTDKTIEMIRLTNLKLNN